MRAHNTAQALIYTRMSVVPRPMVKMKLSDFFVMDSAKTLSNM